MRDANGEVRPEFEEGESYRALAKSLAMHHAGGWSSDSVPGQQAIAEFEAFVRETQARAIEAFVRAWNAEPMSSCPWWVETKGDEYAELVRTGLTDLSGNRVVT